MAEVLSSGVNESNQGQKKRKALQILQITAEEQRRNNMVKPSDKALPSKEKQPKATEKSKVSETENGIEVAVRRSKRAATTVNYAEYLESPEISKATKPVAKTLKSEAKAKAVKSEAKSTKSAAKTKKAVKSKKGSTTVKKNEQAIAVTSEEKENQTDIKLDNPEKCVLTTVPEEDSGYSPSVSSPDKGPINSTAISNDVNIPISVDSEISMIVAENAPLSYWQVLAEQRRVALEAALNENELLHDQLEVLEAENSQLKELQREAENLAKIVKNILE